MDVSTVICSLLSLLTATILFYMQRRQKKADEIAEDHAKARKQEALLSLELSMANNKLSYAVAMAVKRGKPNGEVEDAVATYEAAKKKYYDFLNGQAMEHLQ